MSSLDITRWLWSIATQLHGIIADKQAAERDYRVIVPFVKNDLRQGVLYEDPNIQRAVEKLATLSPYGARAANFRKRYLQDAQGLLSLPDNPQMLPFGYWW